eukprot:jgi/Botrbrau1/18257/Bobra.0682s0001.1
MSVRTWSGTDKRALHFLFICMAGMSSLSSTSADTENGREGENIYHERLRMPRLVCETSGARGRRRPVYQCVQLGTINNLVIMQRDPTPHSEEAFFCNTLVPMHYVQ